jgi:exosortase/archaeosortase family protein
LKFGGLFCLFYFGTLLVIGLSSKENLYSPFVDRYLDFITPLRSSILRSADYLLQSFHYPTSWIDEFTVGITGGQSVRMVYSCVGYGVLSFWAAFVLANDGSILKKVLWLLAGWSLLWVLNVLRIYFLLLALNQNRSTLFGMDHHTLYNIVAYLFIFLMIYFYDRSKKGDIKLAAQL